MKTTTRRLLSGFLGGAAVTAAASTAAAGGFSVARFGGEHGHAATSDVTSIYYNPAGLALEKGHRVWIEGTFAYRTVDYTRDEGAIDNPGTATPDDAIDANAGEAHLGNFLVSPFAGFATDAGVEGLGLGVAFYAPFGGQATWDKNDAYEGDTQYPGAVDGPQRWANITGEQRTLYVTLGAAWTSPGRSVAVGAGLNVIYSDISLVRARNATGTDDLVNADMTVAEGRSLIEATDLTFGLGVGAMWQPNDRARLGLSYQSKPGFGQMSLEGTLTNKFGSAQETEEDIVLLQRMPDIVRFGMVFEATPEVTLRLGADWQRWSAYQNQCLLGADDETQRCTFNEDGSIDTDAGGSSGVIVNLPRDWKDTFGVRAGVGYDLDPTLEVAGSLSYDSNAVPDETMDPSLFDMNKVIVQGSGRKYLATNKLVLSLTVAHVIYFSRTTEPRAVDPMAPSRNPDMAGTYESAVTYGILGVGYRM